MSPRRSAGRDARPLDRRLREERAAVYRQAIAEAAERVFAAKGSDASHMREIASEAGVSLGTLYAVVEGKESLLAGIHRSRMQEFLEVIRAARDSCEGTLARHRAVLRVGARYFLERPDFLRMCSRDGYGWGARLPSGPAESALWEERASIPRDLFETGIAEGIYVEDDPGLMVRKMLALKQVELVHWVDAGMKVPHDEVLDRLERQFVRAFCREGEAALPPRP
jgi:AcrR family transcriptional regulator